MTEDAPNRCLEHRELPVRPGQQSVRPVQRLPGLPGLAVVEASDLLRGRWRVGPELAPPYAGTRWVRHG